MQRQRKRVTSELLDRLNLLAVSALDADALDTALRQVLFRAQALESKSPAEYFAIHGICASLRGDIPGVIQSFETGLERVGWNDFLFHNYVVALDDAAEYKEAAAVARRALVELPQSVDVMDAATAITLHSGDIRTAGEAKTALDGLLGYVAKEFAGLDTFLSQADRTDGLVDCINSAITTARLFLKDAGLRRMVSMSRFTDGMDGNLHMVLNYSPEEPDVDVSSLESALFDRLSELDDSVGVFDWVTISLSRKKMHADMLHAG